MMRSCGVHFVIKGLFYVWAVLYASVVLFVSPMIPSCLRLLFCFDWEPYWQKLYASFKAAEIIWVPITIDVKIVHYIAMSQQQHITAELLNSVDCWRIFLLMFWFYYANCFDQISPLTLILFRDSASSFVQISKKRPARPYTAKHHTAVSQS